MFKFPYVYFMDAQLQNFNGEQHKHFYVVIPQIYKVKFRYMKLTLF